MKWLILAVFLLGIKWVQDRSFKILRRNGYDRHSGEFWLVSLVFFVSVGAVLWLTWKVLLPTK